MQLPRALTAGDGAAASLSKTIKKINKNKINLLLVALTLSF